MEASNHQRRQRQARTLRTFRRIHRTTGIMLFAIFIFIAVSGLLLGWKKHSNGVIYPVSREGSSTELSEWLPLDSLHQNAIHYLHGHISPELSTHLDRIDVRKEKGMVKFIFKDHYYGVQVDGATGALLQIDTRWSDLIENLHDGSILDSWLGTSGQPIKVIYTSIAGLALLTFSITGFWLWYGPKRMRKQALQ